MRASIALLPKPSAVSCARVTTPCWRSARRTIARSTGTLSRNPYISDQNSTSPPVRPRRSPPGAARRAPSTLNRRMATFEELGLTPATLEALAHLGYERPTPIQEQAIPPLLEGRDVIGQAQTGTGKTAAFGLPMVEYVDPGHTAVQALVLTPTRELCIQVTQALRAYGERKGVEVVAVFGGAPIRDQAARLKEAHVAVGTVGRVMDMIGRHHLFLDDARYVVLDEADEMLDLGFLEDVEEIMRRAPMGRQTALFSATVPTEIRRLAEQFMHDPVEIKVRAATLTIDTVDHYYVEVPDRDKVEKLVDRDQGGAPRAGDRLRPHQDRGRPPRPSSRRRRRARQGAPRRHVPGPARRGDDRLQGRPRAFAHRHRRRRPRPRHHGRQPRRQLRHPQLPRRLRPPHRPHRPRRRERPRDHPDHSQAAPRAGGDRAPRQDGDRAVGAERPGAARAQAARAHTARAQAARARDAPPAPYEATRARGRRLLEARASRPGGSTGSSPPTWWAPSSTTPASRTPTCATCASWSASASSRCRPSAPGRWWRAFPGTKVRGVELRLEETTRR